MGIKKLQKGRIVKKELIRLWMLRKIAVGMKRKL
jgi:hypothetical protein